MFCVLTSCGCLLLKEALLMKGEKTVGTSAWDASSYLFIVCVLHVCMCVACMCALMAFIWRLEDNLQDFGSFPPSHRFQGLEPSSGFAASVEPPCSLFTLYFYVLTYFCSPRN